MELLLLIPAGLGFVLLVPIRIRLFGQLEDRIDARGRVALGFGTLAVKADWSDGRLVVRPLVLGIPVWTIRPGEKTAEPDDAEPDEDDDEAESTEEEDPELSPGKGWREKLDDILEYDRRFRKTVLRFLSRLPGVLRLRSLAVRGQYGAETAESTGCLYGYFEAIDAASSDRLDLDVTPNFLMPGFRGSVRAELTVHLARLLRAALRAAVSLGVRYLFMIVSRRYGKRRRSVARAV